jgi:hypothetical protein
LLTLILLLIQVEQLLNISLSQKCKQKIHAHPALKNTDHVWTGTFTDGHNRLTLMCCLKAR